MGIQKQVAYPAISRDINLGEHTTTDVVIVCYNYHSAGLRVGGYPKWYIGTFGLIYIGTLVYWYISDMEYLHLQQVGETLRSDPRPKTTAR